MTPVLVTIAIVAVCIFLAVNGFKHRQEYPSIPKTFEELTCTKHMIVRSMIPGGPDNRVWVYGPHRTSGNACDGAKHIRRRGLW